MFLIKLNICELSHRTKSTYFQFSSILQIHFDFPFHAAFLLQTFLKVGIKYANVELDGVWFRK